MVLAVAASMVLAEGGLKVRNETVAGSLASRPAELIAMIAVGAAISEEAVFRAAMIPAIRTATGSTSSAIVASTLIFALLHLGYGVAKLPITFVSALVFAGLFVWRRSLFSCVVGHALNNLVRVTGLLARSLD